MIDSADQETRSPPARTALAFCYTPPTPFELNASLCRSLAAINATWVGLTNHRLQENFRLQQELAACTSVQAMLRVYCNYCKTSIQQYQRRLGEFQQITLNLMREVPVAGFAAAQAAERSANVRSSQSTVDQR